MSEPRHPLGYLPGIDGLRAVAVSAVFLFHAGVLDGGFIGVDVFFVISGFLITALALVEIERDGHLRLGAFWARRARRLLPALMLVCAAVLVYSVAEGGAALRRAGRDITTTMLYVANWAQIGDGRDYFGSYDAPPLLQHAWSLAVEEQFYLAWPLVLTLVVFAVRGNRTRVRPVVGAVALAAAVGSVAIAFWLRAQDASLSRLYFGTDTRAVGLAVGSVAGCFVDPARVSNAKSQGWLDVVGLGGTVALVALMLRIDGSEQWLYGLGFLTIALASLTVMTASMGRGRVATLLSVRPLVAFGRVSYGFYLWHWPVIVVLDGERTGLGGPLLGSLWLSVTAALTVGSWLVVERRAPLPRPGRPGLIATYAAVAAVLVVASTSATAIENDRFRSADFAIPDPVIGVPGSAPTVPVATTVDNPTDLTPTDPKPTDPKPADLTPADPTPVPTDPVPTDPPAPETLPLPAGRPLRVLVIGDSVAQSLVTSETEDHQVPGFGQVRVRNIAAIACPVIDDGEWWFSDGTRLRVPAVCDGAQRFQSEVDSFRPDVVYVLFGWPGGGGGQQFADGTIVQPCQPGFDDIWRADYQSLVDRLEASTKVVVSTVAPADTDQVDRAVATRCLNASVQQLDATVFDYGEWLCPSEDCSTSRDLRGDRVHFSEIPSVRREVLDAILAQILPIAGY